MLISDMILLLIDRKVFKVDRLMDGWGVYRWRGFQRRWIDG